ncbi:MAG: hypothetical protein AB4060_07525 [Crocosphaera sp.]
MLATIIITTLLIISHYFLTPIENYGNFTQHGEKTEGIFGNSAKATEPLIIVAQSSNQINNINLNKPEITVAEASEFSVVFERLKISQKTL